MPRLFFLVLLFQITMTVFSQKTELDITGSLNFQTFNGNGSVKTTFVNKHAIYDQGYANDRFGRYADPGYGIAFTLQRITRRGILFGISAGTEILKNKIKIDWIHTISGRIPAEGKVTFSSRYLNLIPSAGYRFKINKNYTMDLQGQAEFAIPVSKRSGDGRAVSQDGSLDVLIMNWEGKQFDFRTGLMIAINRKQFSLVGSWSKGYINFMSSYTGAVDETYANIFRTGLRYTWISNNQKKKNQIK